MEPTERILNFFKINSGLYSEELYLNLKNQYNIVPKFEYLIINSYEQLERGYSPGMAIYTRGEWVVKIDFSFNDIERLLCHELLHILLRYRDGFPFLEHNKFTPNQGIILNEMDHRIFNSELDKRCPRLQKRNIRPKTKELLRLILPYLEDLDNEGLDKNLYLEIYTKCANALEEKVPIFIFFQ